MISLPALEEPFSKRYPAGKDGPQVAVEGIELPEGRRIVLFSTAAITLREANALLAEAGFRGVMRLDESRQLEKIPVLGTGKTDYVSLRKLVARGFWRSLRTLRERTSLFPWTARRPSRNSILRIQLQLRRHHGEAGLQQSRHAQNSAFDLRNSRKIFASRVISLRSASLCS